MSPTQRSLAKLRKEGWEVCVVEKWIPQAKKRVDAFGFGDILGYKANIPNYFRPGEAYPIESLDMLATITMSYTTLFQVTTGSNFAARKKKILANEKAKGWFECGNGICIHGWRQLKDKKTGKKKWKCKEEWIKLDEI